ncbi:MAG TPA: tetratricopeptide repeat protein [Candidatus Sulfotelmatobacter sp.]|jgi:tetratricopeptide (TPR) repeat protein|nr:tetratricopeptide repeat protein [Candidatus Sulfotelmatobacter sp.]
MSRLTLFAIPLALLTVGASRAQVPVSYTKPAQASENSSAGSSAMTPRQLAEMQGDIMIARKEYASAIGAYAKVLEVDPKSAQVLNKVGVAFQQLGDLNRAERFYKKAVHADKNFSSAINNYGTVEYEKKHFGKAITLYKKALEYHSEMATLYSNLGYAYFGNKEYPQAMNTFAQALAIDPGIFERKGTGGSVIQQRTASDPGLFYFFVAKTYAQHGDAERAAHYLKMARDDGYNNFLSAQTDVAFARVIKDPRVQEVLQTPPSYAAPVKKQDPN